MNKPRATTGPSTTPADIANLLEQYGCGPIQFAGTDNALYERHLTFRQRDRFDGCRSLAIVSRLSPARCGTSSRSAGCSRRTPTAARTRSASTTSRWSFSSAARWPTMSRICCSTLWHAKRRRRRTSIWLELLEQEPDAGPGQWRAGPPGGLLPRFHGHDAAPGHGLRAAIRIRHLQAVHPGRLAAGAAGQLAAPSRTPGRSLARSEQVEVKLNCSFEVHGGTLRAVAGPAIDSDRHPV